MEKITKDELMKQMNLNSLSDSDLEWIVGGASGQCRGSTWSQCHSKVIDYYSDLMQACRSMEHEYLKPGCYEKCEAWKDEEIAACWANCP